MMRVLGGNFGQRERTLYASWMLTILCGILTHYGYGPTDSALTLLVTCACGVVASYSYRASTANEPAPKKEG